MNQPKVISAYPYDPTAGYGDLDYFYVIEHVTAPFRTDFQLTRSDTTFTNDGTSYFSSGAYVCTRATFTGGVWVQTLGPTFLVPVYAIVETLEVYQSSSGTSGSSGSSGTSGADGTSGTSGSSGTDGSSGTSGTIPGVYSDMINGLNTVGTYPYTLKINDLGGGSYAMVWVDATNAVKKTLYTFSI